MSRGRDIIRADNNARQTRAARARRYENRKFNKPRASRPIPIKRAHN